MLEENRLINALKYLHNTKDLSKELEVSPRELRRAIRKYNDDFHKHEVVIVSNNEGYYLSADDKDIRKYAWNRIKHGLSELRNGKEMLEELGLKEQIGLFDSAINLMDSVTKMWCD